MEVRYIIYDVIGSTETMHIYGDEVVMVIVKNIQAGEIKTISYNGDVWEGNRKEPIMYKNIEKQTKLVLSDQITYQPHQVVSKTLVQNDLVSMTLFSFDKGEEISTHAVGLLF